VNKISQGRPHILDKVKDGQVQWIINTSSGSRTTEDSYFIRRAALDYHIPYTTTISGAVSMSQAIMALAEQEIGVKTVQEFSAAADTKKNLS
jgi:carbamoyl-phosphate synthase large subunit